MQLKQKLKIAAFYLFLAGVLFLGIRILSAARQTIAMPSADRDRLQLEVTAAMLNATQTNWTVVILPRTNQP